MTIYDVMQRIMMAGTYGEIYSILCTARPDGYCALEELLSEYCDKSYAEEMMHMRVDGECFRYADGKLEAVSIGDVRDDVVQQLSLMM